MFSQISRVILLCAKFILIFYSTPVKRDFDFEHLKDRRRSLEEDIRYARAKLEAVTAERDFWMAKIDVLDLERQFWMSELERSVRDRC